MNKFKKMKFWFEAGEVELYDTVCKWLEIQGHTISVNVKPNKPDIYPEGLQVGSDGLVCAACKEKEHHWINALIDYEEINIDWMRIPEEEEPETITLGDHTHLKSELEQAISHINPINED